MFIRSLTILTVICPSVFAAMQTTSSPEKILTLKQVGVDTFGVGSWVDPFLQVKEVVWNNGDDRVTYRLKARMKNDIGVASIKKIWCPKPLETEG